MHTKSPDSGIEDVTSLGYYLTHFRSKPNFKTSEITKLNTEAARASISNTSVFIRDAVAKGYLAKTAKSTEKQLSTLGEMIVEALPDRDQISKILSGNKVRKIYYQESKRP